MLNGILDLACAKERKKDKTSIIISTKKKKKHVFAASDQALVNGYLQFQS